MKTWKQIRIGIASYFSAIRFIFTNGLAWTFLVPVALNVLLFLGGFEAKANLSDKLQAYIDQVTDFENATFWGAEYLDSIMGGLVWFFITVLFFVVFAFMAGYVILIIMSPLLAYLSEKTENILTGADYPFELKQFFIDIFRGIGIALRNLLLEILWALGLFIAGFVPVIGWLNAIALFLISSYFYGFSYIDYYNERKRRNIGQSVEYTRRIKWLAIANGAVFALALLIPFCGVALAAFVAIVSTVAASLALHEIEQNHAES